MAEIEKTENEDKRLLIVYHSQSGRNEALAYAAKDGAIDAESNIEVRLLRAAEAGTRDLLWCDGLMLVFPEYSGSVAGGMKEFLDRVFYPAIACEIQRPYSLFICTGNDGRNARSLAERIFRGIPFRPVSEAKIVCGEPGKAEFDAAKEMAGALAAGLSFGIF